MQILFIYLCAVNIIAFFMYGLDKQKARRNRWRIPEATLIGVAAIGGSVGAYVGMKAFHHKTRKAKFYIGVPVIFILQMTLMVYLRL